jgi:hypothetical protein
MTSLCARLIGAALLFAFVVYAHPGARAQLSCGQKMYTSKYFIGCVGAGISGGGGGGGGGCTGAIDLTQACILPLALGLVP